MMNNKYPKHIVQLLHVSSSDGDYGYSTYTDECGDGWNMCGHHLDGTHYCEKHGINLELQSFIFTSIKDADMATDAINSSLNHCQDYDYSKSTNTDMRVISFMNEEEENVVIDKAREFNNFCKNKRNDNDNSAESGSESGPGSGEGDNDNSNDASDESDNDSDNN